ESIGTEINQAYANSVFYFAFAEVMQVRLPTWIMFQVIGYMLGKENVSGIPAIRHALGDVDASSRNVCLLVQISDFVNRTTVNAHSHAQFRMAFQRLRNFHCAQDWRFRAGAENQRASISGRQPQQFAFRFCRAELLGPAHDLPQFLDLLTLAGDKQFRVTDDVDEQDVPYFEFHV